MKRETFLYEGLGFPVLMVNVPMKKVFGEWVMDINFAELQRVGMLNLAKKNTPLTGREIRSIRHFLNMSTHKFGEALGVSHKVSDREFRKTYSQFDRKSLAKRPTESALLEIDAEKIGLKNHTKMSWPKHFFDFAPIDDVPDFKSLRNELKKI